MAVKRIAHVPSTHLYPHDEFVTALAEVGNTVAAPPHGCMVGYHIEAVPVTAKEWKSRVYRGFVGFQARSLVFDCFRPGD